MTSLLLGGSLTGRWIFLLPSQEPDQGVKRGDVFFKTPGSSVTLCLENTRTMSPNLCTLANQCIGNVNGRPRYRHDMEKSNKTDQGSWCSWDTHHWDQQKGQMWGLLESFKKASLRRHGHRWRVWVNMGPTRPSGLSAASPFFYNCIPSTNVISDTKKHLVKFG